MAVSSIVRNGCYHLFAVLISTGILLLLGLLTKYPITIPHYATEHSVTDAQQVVNLLTIIVAACLFVFMNHCFRYLHRMTSDIKDAANSVALPLKPRQQQTCTSNG
jgi:divalent metal cation (Fe/Co/Zn/Cd) transporter